MAEFCKACSIENFGKDFGELAGITTTLNQYEDKFVLVICEGCGPIQIDIDGNCISNDCLCKGKSGHGVIPKTLTQGEPQ